MDLVNPIVRSWQQDGAEDPEGFWSRAADAVGWFRKWDEVCEPVSTGFRWFAGGRTNLAHNCLDRHVERGRGGHAALIHEREDGFQQTLTYAQLLHRVELAAAALRGIGVGRGDRVAVFMPSCPEAVTIMLACVRVGAVHAVVSSGLGAGALGEQIKLAEAKAVFTTDVSWRDGALVPLKATVDEAVAEAGWSVTRVVVLRRGDAKVPMLGGRDLDWEEFLTRGHEEESGVEEMESNEAAFVLATPGSSGALKARVQAHGPYQVLVRSMAEWVFDLKEDDVWWSTHEVGTLAGHSYTVYGPLLAGCTTICHEGALDQPGPDAAYGIIEENGVTGVLTSPEAIRVLMSSGVEASEQYDLASLERVFSTGEVLEPAAWSWLQKDVLGDRVPVLDHWWPLGAGGPVVGNPYGLQMVPIKPGSAGLPLPGMEVAIAGRDGEEVGPNETGTLVLKSNFPGVSATAGEDLQPPARIDEDGYVWFSPAVPTIELARGESG